MEPAGWKIQHLPCSQHAHRSCSALFTEVRDNIHAPNCYSLPVFRSASDRGPTGRVKDEIYTEGPRSQVSILQMNAKQAMTHCRGMTQGAHPH